MDELAIPLTIFGIIMVSVYMAENYKKRRSSTLTNPIKQSPTTKKAPKKLQLGMGEPRATVTPPPINYQDQTAASDSTDQSAFSAGKENVYDVSVKDPVALSGSSSFGAPLGMDYTLGVESFGPSADNSGGYASWSADDPMFPQYNQSTVSVSKPAPNRSDKKKDQRDFMDLQMRKKSNARMKQDKKARNKHHDRAYSY